MKHALLLTVMMLVLGTSIFGKQVDEITAQQVGENFLAAKPNPNTKKSLTNLQLIYKVGSKNTNNQASNFPTTYFYIFNAGSDGFIIVSGDDNVVPILGYSDHSTFDPDNIPQNVAKWLEGYKAEIRYCIEQNILPTRKISEQWESLKSLNSATLPQKETSGVNPLMQTKWDQSPYYNALCPGGSVTGCVATAMAQIMKYWNYPATGSGFHSYNHPSYGTLSANFGSTTYQWNLMPNSVNNTNNAVATLMYQVGVSVDMTYSPDVSGAYMISAQSPVTHCSEYALKTYFGYKNTLQGVQRKDYNQDQWVSLMKAELNAGRPVLYAGFGSGGGHCFVTDGYDNNDYFHFNWGWGGYFDGYFQINALNPSGTGTGGGTGGFNSGHQALIGIESPEGNNTYNLALYNYVMPSASTIYYGQAFTVTTNIANYGTNTFTGDYSALVFDDAYNFIDDIQILTNCTLQGGYAYNDNLVFSTSGLFSLLPGTYYIGVFFRPTGGDWILAANEGYYSNLVEMSVINPNDIELNSSLKIMPGNSLTQGKPASVNLNIINDGFATFTGYYGVGLYHLDGSLAQTIQVIGEENGLPYGYTYLSPYLTFSTSAITVSPGSYLIAVQHKPDNSDWELTGSSYFQNPVKVTVVAPLLQPDSYEQNNSISESFNLPINFSGNNTSVQTTGSNCHTSSDQDFYKIILPSGFNYALSTRLHDSHNSGDGNTYSLDGLFSYSTDGTNWSDAYDDVMTGNILINNGGTVYFHVAPYFSGETGSYLLSMTITKSSGLGIDESPTEDLIKVYPNPAKDFVQVDFNAFSGECTQINLLNVEGQMVFSENIGDNTKTFKVPLANLAKGVYFLQLQTDSGLSNRKIVISD